MKKTIILLFLISIGVSSYSATYHDLINAGRSAADDNNFERAKYFYEQALGKIPSDSIVDIYDVCSLIRNLYLFNLHSYEESIDYGKKVLSIRRKVKRELTPDLAEEYNMVAYAYSRMGRKEECFCYLDSAEQCLSSPGGDLYDKIGDYWAIGASYSNFEDWEQASCFYKRAVDELRNEPLDDNILKSLNLYANSLFKQGKYDEAKKVFDERMILTGQYYGKDSKDYRWAYYNFANILAFAGEIDLGGQYYMDVAAQYRDLILKQLRYLPSEKREAYLDDAIEIVYNMIPFGVAAKFNEDEFTEAAYNGLLLTKGLLLASEKAANNIIEENGSDQDKANLRRLNELQQYCVILESDRVGNADRILFAYNEIKELDSILALSCELYGNISAFGEISYSDIKNRLGDDDVLLDFTDFKPNSRPRQYVCYEIRKNQRYPKLHVVCNGAEIDSLLQLENGYWSNLYTGESAVDMARIIGKPLNDIIGDASNVYYVPSGVLHKLSIEAINVEGNMFGDSHSFKRLSSAREIVNGFVSPQFKSAQIYGGLNYDYGVSENLHGQGLKPLSESLKEAVEINDIVGALDKVNLLTGDFGVKLSFTNMSGKAPELLHISTHGYYYAPMSDDLPASLQGYNDAMALSGLMMTGANCGWLGLEKSAGMLSADEISRCDLSNVSVACLASCYSGQGEVTPEGIYGLQRAFKKAGAKCVVMSLWEASDVATRYFMNNFYSDLINGSKNRHKAFQYARNKVREKYSSPFYWAGFIMLD